MMRSKLLAAATTLALAGASLGSGAASAADAALDCELKFSLTGWSAIFQHAEGAGVVTCENGLSTPVDIKIKGAGLSVGKYHIDDGKGTFTDVHKLSDVFGDYAGADANAGAVKAGTAQVLTKGTVSLALAGAGEGVNIGIGVNKLTLSPVKPK